MKKIYLNDTTNTKTTLKDKMMNEIMRRYGFGQPKTELHLGDLVFTSYEPVEVKAIPCPFFIQLRNEITDKLRYGLFETKKKKEEKNRELAEAMARLQAYAKTVRREEENDELYFMGTKIRFYDNFIQVGSEIISLYDYKPYFKKNPDKTIINIIISLSANIDL